MKDHHWHPWGIFVVGVAVASLTLSIVCLITWGLWVNVVPHFWPTGPQEIINPDYWNFYFAVLLFIILRKLFFGDQK